MLTKAGVGDGSRFGTIVDRTPPFLLFLLHEALSPVAEWELIPQDLAEIYDAITHGDESVPSRAIKTGFEYVQVPYTYLPLERRF